MSDSSSSEYFNGVTETGFRVTERFLKGLHDVGLGSLEPYYRYTYGVAPDDECTSDDD